MSPRRSKPEDIELLNKLREALETEDEQAARAAAVEATKEAIARKLEEQEAAADAEFEAKTEQTYGRITRAISERGPES